MRSFLDGLMNAIGRTINDAEHLQFCEEFGIPNAPLFPDEDDYTTYQDDKRRGFSLIYYRQSSIKHPKHQGKSRDLLVLAGCHFYAEGHEGYYKFNEVLPHNLAFEDDRSVVWEKLGTPVWQYAKDQVVLRERWDFDDFQLNTGYRSSDGSLLVIFFGIRQYYKNTPKMADLLPPRF